MAPHRSTMYCSVCGNKVDSDNFLGISVVEPSIKLCSFQCVDELQTSLRYALENHKPLALTPEEVDN